MSELVSNTGLHIITSPEDLPEGVSYRDLGGIVGYKAASILWVQQYLPHIPTARMIVAPPGIQTEEILRTARQQGLRFPWIIRSSAPEDNLPGYEGVLPTLTCEDELASPERKIMEVKYSPSVSRGKFRTPEATVIIAEKSLSRLVGTIAAHPHKDNLLVGSVSNFKRPNDPVHATFFIESGTVQFSPYWSSWKFIENLPFAPQQLLTIATYYQQIGSLPAMNPAITHQMEFGLESTLYFQFRDFLPKQKSSFTLPETEEDKLPLGAKPMVFGITPPEGVIAQVYDSYEFTSGGELQRTSKDIPVAIISKSSGRIGQLLPQDVNLFVEQQGMLAHTDVHFMRTCALTVIGADGWWDLPTGQFIRIFSDGERVRIEME